MTIKLIYTRYDYDTNVPVWSVSVYDDKGANVYNTRILGNRASFVGLGVQFPDALVEAYRDGALIWTSISNCIPL